MIMNTYERLPVTFTHGKGCWIWDNNDHKYLDALSGIAVCGLGHAHPEITQCISTQAAKLLHTSNLYHIENQYALSEKLCQISEMEACFFCNSGTESVEAAIKIARLSGLEKKIKVPKIIVMQNSFHGRTFGALSATINKAVQAPFKPLLPGFLPVEYNNIDAINNMASQHSDIVAILVEPVQGEGGIIIPDSDYLTQLREICDQHQWLLMLDEIQTGMGRSGKWFAFQHTSIKVDVLTLAKGLANGIPIGCCLARSNAAKLMQPGYHGSTFGGNPLATAVALKTIEIIEKNQLQQNATTMSATICNEITKQCKHHPITIHHLGLLIGIKLDQPCTELVKQALNDYLLINVTQQNTIRLLPPLIISQQESMIIGNKIATLLNTFYGKTR